MSSLHRLSHRPAPSHWARVVVFVTAMMLLATACGGGVATIEAAAAQQTNAAESAADGVTGTGTVADASFTRGQAVLPRDHCMGNGVLIANVLHVDDLAAAGFPVTAEAYVGGAQQDRGSFDVPSYPERGQVNCSADLGANNSFFFELHRNGRGLALHNEVREQHTIAGVDFIDAGDGVLLSYLVVQSLSLIHI